MNGKLPKYDKNHVFIYYLTNINPTNLTAKIKVINHELFKTFKLNPTNFRISEQERKN